MGGKSPAGWSERRFSEFCSTVEVRAAAQADLPLFSVTKDAGVCLQSATNRKQIGQPDFSTYKVARRGQFALAPMALYYGAIGRVNSVDAGLISPAYTVFEVDQSVSPEFFTDLIRMPTMVARYAALAEGGNLHGKRKITTFGAFCSVRTAVPPLEEQRVIASHLGAIDDTIRTTEAYLDQLRATKHQVMRELLTLGHPEFRTKMVRLKEPWRIGRVAPIVEKIPKHWELIRLTKVACLESGHTPSRKHPEYWGAGTAWLSLGDTSEMKKLQVMTTAESVTQAGLDNSSARLLPTDTVVLSRTAVRGLCSRLGKPMATSQDFVGFVCSERVLPSYLVQVFRHMKREWRRLEQGTSPTNKTLYFSVFKRLKVALPSPEEQRAIATVGESFDQRLVDETAALDQLREAKRGLAQALLTGRIRVPMAGPGNGAKGGS